MLTAEQQAWLDETPEGTSRTITRRIGEMSIDYTVDRRNTEHARTFWTDIGKTIGEQQTKER